MAIRMTAADAAAKWSRRASQATEDFKKGVQGVESSPTAAAARNLEKARTNYNDAIDSGRMARRLNAVSREDWINRTLSLGATRYAPGVQAAVGKMQSFMEDFFPVLDRAMQTVSAMPNVTFEDSVARMTQNARMLHEYSRR